MQSAFRGEEWVGDGVGDVLALEEGLEFVEVAAALEQRVVLPLGDAPDEQFHGNVVLWKMSGDLLGEKDSGQSGQWEEALEGVVVGEREESEAAMLEGVVEGARIGVAFGDAKFAQEPFFGSLAEFGMDMQINAGHVAQSSGIGRRVDDGRVSNR